MLFLAIYITISLNLAGTPPLAKHFFEHNRMYPFVQLECSWIYGVHKDLWQHDQIRSIQCPIATRVTMMIAYLCTVFLLVSTSINQYTVTVASRTVAHWQWWWRREMLIHWYWGHFQTGETPCSCWEVGKRCISHCVWSLLLNVL